MDDWIQCWIFFLVGFLRGAGSADNVAEAFTATLGVALAAIGIAGGGSTTVDGSLQGGANLWATVFYFSGMALLAWVA